MMFNVLANAQTCDVAIGMRVFLLLTVSSLFATSGLAWQADTPPRGVNGPELRIREVTLGLANHYKMGHWTAVTIGVDASLIREDDQVIVIADDPEGATVQYNNRQTRWTNSTGGTASTTVFSKLGNRNTGIQVTWRRNSGELVATRRLTAEQLPEPHSTDHQWVMTAGKPVGVSEAILVRNRHSADPIIHVQVSPKDLPQHVLGFSSVDSVVLITGADDTWWEEVPAETWRALVAWVFQGGELILGGSGRSRLLNRDGILAAVVPGKLQGIIEQRQTSGIEQFTAATTRLDRNTSGRFVMPMADLQLDHGHVEVWEGFGNDQKPCVVRAAAGLGQVVFVGVDLDAEPFASWADRTKFVGHLVDLVLDSAQFDEAYRSDIGPVTHVGYTDLVGQLRGALDQFHGVRLVPFSWIAVLAAIYIAIIGPLDYWLLNRWRRPEWTWLTFAVTVAAFVALSTWLSHRWKGSSALVNQVTVVDADLSQDEIRGVSWAHLYSPRTQRIDIHGSPALSFGVRDPIGFVTSWQGLPGDGFGGLERNKTASLFDQPYRSELQLSGVDFTRVDVGEMPIAVWSSRSISQKWWGKTSWPTERKQTRLVATSEGALKGQLTNPWPVDLKDTLLLYDRWAYRIGTLDRASTIPIAASTGIDLQTLLTQRTVEKGRNVVTPWDRESVDVDRIVQLLLFYEAAKGRAYTQLKNRYQDELDWSRHLLSGRVILWGRCDESGTQIRINDQEIVPNRSRTYCRLLIPLTRAGDGERQP